MRTEQFDKAIQTVTKERGENYGSPLVNFERMAPFFKILKDCPDPVVRHALYMIAVNMVRLVETPYYEDGPIDIAGYARTICMAHDEREKSMQEMVEERLGGYE